MPCWEINLMTVEFKAKNKTLLLEVLKKLKYDFNISENGNRISFKNEKKLSFTLDLTKQKVTMDSAGFDTINLLKRNYSKAILEMTAKKKLWAIRKTAQRNKFSLVKY